MLKSETRKPINPRDRRGSFFCITGCGWQIMTSDGKCPICHTRVVRQPTYENVVDYFLGVIDANKEFFDHYSCTEFEMSFKVPVQMGHLFYFVPLKHFITLSNMERTDRSQYEVFFEYVKNNCLSKKL